MASQHEKDEIEERKIQEAKTKLRDLHPMARAEVVNAVLNRQVRGFTDFLREQGIVGVGIGLVLGIQLKAVVDQIMISFVNPVTTLILPGKQTLEDQSLTINIGSQSATIGWGAIVYTIVTFIMVAIIVYAGFKLLKLDKFTAKPEVRPEETTSRADGKT